MKKILINIIFSVLVIYAIVSYLSKLARQYEWMGVGDLVDAYKTELIEMNSQNILTNGEISFSNGIDFVTNRSREDFFIYGPYANILDGKYWLSIQGLALNEGKVGHVQISSEKGKKILFYRDFEAGDLPLQETIDLPSAKYLEIKIASFTDNNKLLIKNINLKRLDIYYLKFIANIDNRLRNRLIEFWGLKAYK